MDSLMRIRKTKVSLQKEKPFFSDLLFYLKIIRNDELVPSMGVTCGVKGVGDSVLYFNEEWVASLKDIELKGVLAHEALHIGLLHVLRGINKPNKLVWNLAIDCQVNYICVKNGFRLPGSGGCVPNMCNNSVDIMEEKSGCIYTVKDIEDKSSEQIYNELMENLPKKYLKLPRIISISIGLGEGDKEGGFKAFDVHIEGTLSKEEAQRLENVWKQRLINAVSRSKSIGKSPAGLDRIIDGLLEPEIDWSQKIYLHISNDIPHDFTYRKPHKRSYSLGFYNPSYEKESLEVSIWFDTSASINDKDLIRYKSECIGIAQAFECVDMTIGYCDAAVQGEPDKVENSNIYKIMSCRPKGGGGTNMKKIFPWMNEHQRDAKNVVIFTDGYTEEWPSVDDLAGRKVLWVITKNGVQKVPDGIGDMIKLAR
jgi:predicted metal-dependent peptidase